MTFTVEEVERQGHCDKHGAYTVQTKIVNGRELGAWCRICSAEESARADAEEREREYRSRIMESGLPELFKSARVDNFPDQVEAWMTAWEAKASRGPLVLVGGVGTGKTHLAACALKRVFRARTWGGYLSAIDYGRRVRETWSTRKEETERVLLERHANAGFLVLDELGANRSADESIIQDLICARYDAGKMRHTIIVSNLAPAALDSAIGERAADRIREGATLVTISGASRRRPAA